MRCVLERVDQASVSVSEQVTGSIGKGLLIYCAISENDTQETVKKMAAKIVNLRIFPDEQGMMNISLLGKGYSCLLVSQFTLFADVSRGNRPFYGNRANPVLAKQLCDELATELKKYAPCETGVFGADMRIVLTANGPVTILIDSGEI